MAPLQDNGVTYNDPESKAQIINKAFSSVFTHEDVSTMPMLTESYPDMPPIQIDPERHTPSFAGSQAKQSSWA